VVVGFIQKANKKSKEFDHPRYQRPSSPPRRSLPGKIFFFFRSPPLFSPKKINRGLCQTTKHKSVGEKRETCFPTKIKKGRKNSLPWWGLVCFATGTYGETLFKKNWARKNKNREKKEKDPTENYPPRKKMQKRVNTNLFGERGVDLYFFRPEK